MQVGTTNYFYTRDRLGSIRELTNGSGTVQTRYDYDSYGRRTKVSGTIVVDFGFTGYYFHQPSGLNLALYRAYDADLGRWISRDPLENAEFLQGPNLYGYVGNNPVIYVDPDGRIFFIFTPVVILVIGIITAIAVGTMIIQQSFVPAKSHLDDDPNCGPDGKLRPPPPGPKRPSPLDPEPYPVFPPPQRLPPQPRGR
jgi:RHS repeat-associated protein